MGTYTRYNLSQNLSIKAVVKAAFPDYRKRDAVVTVWGGSHSINSYWDGGSRSEYAIIELATLQRHPLPTSTHPYFDVAARGLANAQDEHISIDRVGNVTLKHLPDGFVLVQAGTFCGKPATAYVRVPPNNMPKLLEQGV